MTILNNYLYKYILKVIINTLYNKNVYKNDFYVNCNNEIIKYSLVCKSWFEFVAELLGDCLNYNTSSQSLNDYKLIKVRNIEMKSYGNDDQIQSILKVFETCNQYKQVYITIQLKQVLQELLYNLDKVPDNVNLELIYYKFTPIYNNINSYLMNKIDKLIITDFKNLNSILNLQSLPKHIEYNSYSGKRFKTFNMTLVFESTNDIEININDLILPSNSNNNNNDIDLVDKGLIKFTLKTTIKDLLDITSYNDNNNNNKDDDSKWSNIINRLSNEPTLNSITINNDGYHYESNGGVPLSDINSGLKRIISALKSLESFTIDSKYIIDKSILEGIALNKSIKTLEISQLRFDIPYLIKNVLLINRSIRNLYINDPSIDKMDWLSMFNDPKLQLYLYIFKISTGDAISIKTYINQYAKLNSFNVNHLYINSNFGFHDILKSKLNK